MGFQTGATLGVIDTFYLGRLAHMQNKPKVAMKWLTEAALQAASDPYKEVEQSQVDFMESITVSDTKINFFYLILLPFSLVHMFVPDSKVYFDG